MFSQEDFLVSLSPSQAREWERTMTATSGQRCYGQFGRFSPLGSFVRTLLASGRWWSKWKLLRWGAQTTYSSQVTYTERKDGSRSKESARTLKTLAIPSRRLIFQLAVSEHPTEETGSGLLPTVQTQGLKRCSKEGKTEFYPTELLPTPTALDFGSGRINKSASPGAKERPTIAKTARMGLLPTTNAVEATKYTHKLNPSSQMGRSLTALAVNGLMPTPSARDYKGNTITTTRRRKGQFTRWGEMLPDFITRLNEEQTGDSKASPQLNPLFVEEMMGFPFGWTTYPFLSESGDRKA